MANNSITVQSLFRDFGKAALDAQSQLNIDQIDQSPAPDGTALGIVIRDIELDVKLLFDDEQPAVQVLPVTVAASQAEGFDSAVLSSIKASLTAVPEEQQRTAVRSADEVRDEVLARDDVAALEPILGELTLQPAYVSSLRKWVVEVVEPGGEIVRSIQIADVAPSAAAGT